MRSCGASSRPSASFLTSHALAKRGGALSQPSLRPVEFVAADGGCETVWIEERGADNSARSGAVPGGEGAYAAATGRDGKAVGWSASVRALTRRVWPRRATGDHAIASLDSLLGRAQELSRAPGQDQDGAAAIVVEDLERAAAALTARTAPLVPGCGVLVAVSGLAVKAEPTSNPIAETFVSLAVLFAVGGFAFLTRALFLYAGRRLVGLSPTVNDIAFARDRLVRKHTSAHRGGLMAGIGLTCLIIGILAGVHISIG